MESWSGTWFFLYVHKMSDNLTYERLLNCMGHEVTSGNAHCLIDDFKANELAKFTFSKNKDQNLHFFSIYVWARKMQNKSTRLL